MVSVNMTGKVALDYNMTFELLFWCIIIAVTGLFLIEKRNRKDPDEPWNL